MCAGRIATRLETDTVARGSRAENQSSTDRVRWRTGESQILRQHSSGRLDFYRVDSDFIENNSPVEWRKSVSNHRDPGGHRSRSGSTGSGFEACREGLQ